MKSMADKLKESEPYNLFFTGMSDLEQTTEQPSSIQFKDLLCPSLGQIKSILFVTSSLDLNWVIEQLDEMSLSNLPITIIHGGCDAPVDEVLEEKTNIRMYNVQDAGYTNFAKICIFLYEDDSIRIVVTSSNLKDKNWHHHVHCVWISELCPTLSPHSTTRMGQGITYFKQYLYSFLWSYETPILKEWLDRVEEANFDAIKVSLVASAPGYYRSDQWRPVLCHALEVRRLLSTNCDIPISENSSWPVIAQVTTIGAIGISRKDWLEPTLLEALCSIKNNYSACKNDQPKLKLIFPTKANVENSLYDAGSEKHLRCYVNDIELIRDMLCIWKVKSKNNFEVLPQMKSYFRISPCKTKLAWFLFTSANFSKSAWGAPGKNGFYLSRSYHIGVMFLPKFYGQEYFQISGTTNDGSSFKPFPLIYDIPLVPYTSEDEAAHYGEEYVHLLS